MLYEEMTSDELNFFMKEIFSSLKDTNKRMNELKFIMKLPACNLETKNEIKERFKRLQQTKFCLIYSIYDVRTRFVKIFGEPQYQKTLGTIRLYEELRDL